MNSPPHMSYAAQQISLFCDQIKERRFDDTTMRILASILDSKDVKSLLELRSELKKFLLSESLIIREAAERPIEYQLLIIDFFVRALAIVGDVESCLSLRYEALVMRDTNSRSHKLLEVSYCEWMTFAEHAAINGFYSVAGKACEYALLHLHINGNSHKAVSFENSESIDKIQRLKDATMMLSATHNGGFNLEVQAMEYLKKKTIANLKEPSISQDIQNSASTCFRNGIKMRNMHNLRRQQSLLQHPGESNIRL